MSEGKGIRVSGVKFEWPTARVAGAQLGEVTGWESRPGGWWIATLSTGERVRLRGTERGGKIAFWIAGKLLAGEVLFEARGGAAGAGDTGLVSQFPGKVRKLLVAVGDEVAEGTPLLSMEAMKMEFVIKAPFAGRVRGLPKAEGAQVSPGEALCDLEALKK